MEYSNLFVCLMGIGTVFVGLACIVFLVMVMSAICRKLSLTDKAAPVAAAPVAAAPAAPQAAANQGALMAAIAAAIAEDMGTDVSAIRIVSIKKV